MRELIIANFRKYRSLVLLFALLTVIVALPLDTVNRELELGIRLAYIALFCVGGYLLHSERWWLTSYIIIAVPTLLLSLIDLTPGENHFLYLTSRFLTIVLQVLLIFAVFRYSLFRRAAHQADRIIAGICGYLILGLIWASFFAMLETLALNNGIASFQTSFLPDIGEEAIPENAVPDPEESAEDRPVLHRDSASVYYSFVTLTTLGYGDITPITPWSRILSSMEAVIGTLYLTIFIATIISGGRKER